MRFTREVSLAVELLSRAPCGAPRQVKELAETLGTTEYYLQRIVGKLRRAKLIQVKRGPGGGIMSGKTPGSISMLDVYQALGKAGTNMKQGSFLDRVHTNVLNLLGTERIPYLGVHTKDG